MKYLKTAIILCGGESQRMGFNKQLLQIDNDLIVIAIGKKLMESFNEIIIVTNKPQLYKNTDFIVVKDIVQDFGPIAGIHSGLSYAKSEYSFVIAGDMPNVNLNYIRWLDSRCRKNLDIIVAKYLNWHIEPFNGVYSERCIPIIEEAFKTDTRKIIDLYSKLNVEYLSDEQVRKFSSDWNMFFNLNTVEDTKAYMDNSKIRRLL